MSINADDEILQDFLVEAGEILEQLGEQLVDLEQRPGDYDLLNTVFRGFHTIKGGAGFLNLTALVAVCHRAEDVFNVLRQGQRRVDAVLMDTVLKVLDVVNAMFRSVRDGQEPEHADPALLQQLSRLAQPASAEPEPPPAPLSAPVNQSAVTGQSVLNPVFDVIDDISAMLTPPSEASATATAQNTRLVGGDDMTDEEFESLLDHLQGSGKASHPASPLPPEPETAAFAQPDEITDLEFEAILDNLHGKGQFVGTLVPVATMPPPPPPKSSVPPLARHEEEEAEPTAKGKPAAAAAGPAHVAETTVRVDTQRLDDIMNMVGELVLVRNRLANLRTVIHNEDVANAVGNLDVVTSNLQLAVMKTRMQPIKKVFGRFPRVVRDLARSLKKEIDLELVGEETDLDKNLVEALADPLIHLVRNSVDHGIELPADRELAGKPRKGRIILSAAQEGDHIRLSISDDGKGMDPEMLRQKVVEKGLMDAEAAARLDEKDCFHLIFMPGFSTKAEISDVSGRGVG
ncbi:MAG: chemotaxis protein CheA, partial [Pseudomonadota bacterium]